MNADPVVAADLGGPLTRSDSDAKFTQFSGFFRTCGYGRWVVEDPSAPPEGQFLGYCGLKPHGADHPLGAHSDIGWRLCRKAWGNGYAPEAARAALDDAFTRTDLQTVYAYTAADNHRSQSVMTKLGLERRADLDFAIEDESIGQWRGLVWVADRPDHSSAAT